MADQLSAIQKTYPAMKWHQWEPAGPHSARAGAMLAFGQPLNTYYNLAAANVIVSLDSDFLACGPASLRYARQFAARRRVRGEQTAMNRLYVVEPMPTATGSKADHRLALRAADIEVFAGALSTAIGTGRGPGASENPEVYNWIGPLGRDLLANKGASLVIAGEQQSAAVHALAHAMNATLGNVGKTVFYTDPIEAGASDQAE
jgi:molybdopterin-containing oxidoreductase family iron-sulfur binding subunit